MKLTILVLAILGVATAASVPTSKVQSRVTKHLADDWADFKATFDLFKARRIVAAYLCEDAEVQALGEYLQSENFTSLINAIDAIPEFHQFLHYLNNAGLNARKNWRWIVSWVNRDSYTSSRSMCGVVSTPITGGIAGLWADLKDCVDWALAREMWDDKLENSEEFRAFIEILKSDEAKTVYATLKANEDWQELRGKAMEHGIDIDWAIDWVKNLICWE